MKPDRNTLGAVLDVVAQQARDSFTLHRHLYATDVRQDWPLYGDDDRRVLSRYPVLVIFIHRVVALFIIDVYVKLVDLLFVFISGC